MTALQQVFAERFGSSPEGVWGGPGRVNLIGEHVDYNDGLVLPFAIERRALVAVRPRTDGVVRAASLQTDEVIESSVRATSLAGWGGYVVGVAWALLHLGLDVPGFDLLLDSDIPIGSGLSSSAGIETATALALSHLAGTELTALELALACHRAETGFVGAPVGVMDQVVSACASTDHALLLDCRTLDQTQVPLTLPGCTLVVIDSRVRHTNTDGAYAERRASCDQAAATLGVKALRDADVRDVQTLPDPLRRRAMHVVAEIARVEEAVSALRDGNTTRLGELLIASHHSLRDDFEVSCPELDLAVEAALDGGALGARLTGAGFGGCVVALVPDRQVSAVAFTVTGAFLAADLPVPEVFPVRAGPGAARIH